MLYLRFLVVLLVFSSLVSCGSPGGSINRAASAEITAQDVVDAWDIHCGTWNFDPCPSYVLDTGLCNETMDDMYNGNNYAIDSDGLMLAMGIELDRGGAGADPDPDELINAVINDSQWF